MARPSNDLCLLEVKGDLFSWITMTFIMSANFIRHHIAQELDILLSKVVFHFLAVIFLNNLLVSTSLYIAKILQMGFGGGPPFLASHEFVGVIPIQPPFVYLHLAIETKLKLAPPFIDVFVNFRLNSLPSWHITTLPQAHRFAPKGSYLMSDER